MAEPSIIVDLLLRDLTAATVDAIAARIKTQLESLSVNIPVAVPEKIQATTKAVSTLKTDVGALTAATEKHRRATMDDALAGKISTDAFIREAAARKAATLQLEHAVNKATLPLLSTDLRDAMGKRLGRSTVTIEDPFGSLVSREGVKARFQSLFAGQVGTLIVYGTLLRGIVKGTQEFIRANIELEDSLAKVSTIIEGSGDRLVSQYNALREQAVNWGRSHAQSAKEAADAMYFLLSAGESVQEVQRNLPAILNLAYGGYIDTAFAAETVATAYELFRKEGVSVVDIVNKIQRTNEVSQVTVEQYANAFTYLASTADQAKISFDEVSAAIGTLGTLGLRGSKGGRNLDEAIGQLLKKQGDLRALGIEIADVNGDLKDFADILDQFRKKLGSKVDVVELKILRDIFGQQGGRAMGLLIENTDLYLENLEKIKHSEGEIYDAAFKRGDTLSQIWEKFKNQLQGVALTIGAEPLKVFLGGGTESLRSTFSTLDFLKGDQGAGAVRFGIKKLQEATDESLQALLFKIRSTYGDKAILGEVNIFDKESLERARGQAVTFFEALADKLEQGEGQDRVREVVAGILHIQPQKLERFTFLESDLGVIRGDARGFFEAIRKSIETDIKVLGESAERTSELEILDGIIAGITGDRKLTPVRDKINSFFAQLSIAISRAQLEVLRSGRTVDFDRKLEIIDLDVLINLRKNREEYEKELASIPEEVKNVAKDFERAKSLLKRELDLKDIVDRNKGAAAKIRLQIDTDFGESVIERLRRDLASARLSLAKSLPDEWLRLGDKLQLIDEQTLADFDKNKASYLSRVKSLPDEILADAGKFAEAKKVLQQTLRIEDTETKNRAFFEKDKTVRGDIIRQFEAQLQRETRLQELYLDQSDAGDERRRAKRNELLKRELLDRTKFLAPTIRLQFDDKGRLTTDTTAFFRQVELVGRLREEIEKLDLATLSVEGLENVTQKIREIGIEAGLTGDTLDEFVERILKFDPKIETTTQLIGAFTDAFGSLAGAMQVIGNKNTWQSIAQGISLVDSTYAKVKQSLDLLNAGMGLQGALGIASAAFSVVGFIASLLDREEKKNLIGTEEYQYQAGRNVSPNYGRAMTVNVQVDLNPSFNFLDPSGLTEQRQREIAHALGDEIDDYFEDTGRFTRR